MEKKPEDYLAVPSSTKEKKDILVSRPSYEKSLVNLKAPLYYFHKYIS